MMAITRGHQQIEEAMAILQKSGNRWGYTMSLMAVGMTAKFNGNYDEGAANLCFVRSIVS